MRKLMCLLCALLVGLTLVCPVFAATDTFVPSISYKNGPDVEAAELNGEEVDDCVEVSSIKDARDKSTGITQEDRDLLLDIYSKLSDGSMELPLSGDYVIRELVDVSFEHYECVIPGHVHEEDLANDGTTITITFDLGVDKYTDVAVLSYVDGEWIPAESVKNNGDGTVTVVFEEICPVVFCVDADANDIPAKTGDTMGQSLMLWIVLMAVSFAGIVVLMILRRRIAR